MFLKTVGLILKVLNKHGKAGERREHDHLHLHKTSVTEQTSVVITNLHT